ncbi:MAG TPA: fatty acid--CoA ligase family protein [Mycolicibacterium fallax]|nr:fatty acid--CoA ligase family protein [Mycolicibacterium fallax]
MGFASTLAQRIAGHGPRDCIEFDGVWHSGDELVRIGAELESALREAGVGGAEPIGLVVRNRVPHAAMILGGIAAGRGVSMIYSHQSDAGIAADIRSLGLPAVVAAEQDWGPAARRAAREAGSAAIAIGPPARVLTPRSSQCPAAPPDPGLRLLTSGTTGPPKRVALPERVLEHNVAGMTLGRRIDPDDPPALVFWPFGSVGVCQLLAAAHSGQRIVLLERFAVAPWVDAVRRHRIRWSGVAPTVIRMLLDADVPPEDLASLEYLPGGSGPLEPALQRAFEARYRIPLIWAYGATEFAGTVCSWTPELRAQFGDTKVGTVGRPLPGVAVRILGDDGAELPAGTRGRLSARVAAIGPDWIDTTDIACIDDDGFLTVHGRGDGAINRGGFKVLPERVRAVLLGHPAVRDAAVVGVPDARLGEVPFAAVELLSGAADPGEQVLKDLVREALPAPNVPVAVARVAELPHNAVLKVRLDAVRELYRG